MGLLVARRVGARSLEEGRLAFGALAHHLVLVVMVSRPNGGELAGGRGGRALYRRAPTSRLHGEEGGGGGYGSRFRFFGVPPGPYVASKKLSIDDG
jgi:hypothetical protein